MNCRICCSEIEQCVFLCPKNAYVTLKAPILCSYREWYVFDRDIITCSVCVHISSVDVSAGFDAS
jgi:hypothetical protein